MKKLFLFVALFSWIGFSASAQVRKESTKKEVHKESKMGKDHKESKMKTDHEKSEMKMGHQNHHWVYKDGKVMEMKDGKSTEMKSETHVGDVWIRPNGDIVMKNNKVVHLKADEYLDSKGMIHHMEKMKTEKMNMDKNKMEPPKIETQ